MADRFDLEQHILNCWNVTSDMELIAKRPMTDDERTKALEALNTLYTIRFNELWETFEELVQNGKV